MKQLVWAAGLFFAGSACAGSVFTDPASPSNCEPVAIHYDPTSGPLAASTSVFIHVGFNGWQGVIHPDPSMSPSSTNWTFTYYPHPGTEIINLVFNDGIGTWDNNGGSDWNIPLTDCDTPDHVSIGSTSGHTILAPTGANQNAAGETFSLRPVEGSAAAVAQGGFGSFGELILDADSNYLYLGARGMDSAGSNNFLALFLDVNTLSDDRLNLWNQAGAPGGLDHLHNIQFESPMDIALLLGSEHGDETDDMAEIPSGDVMGQGVFYLSGTNFIPVGGVLLSQFDSETTAGPDDDGNDLTDTWMAAIPWSSLNATSVADLTSAKLCGVIASASESGNDRYLSSNYLGRHAAYSAIEANRNAGFNFMTLTPVTLYPANLIANQAASAADLGADGTAALSFSSSTGSSYRIYKGTNVSGLSLLAAVTASPPSQVYSDTMTEASAFYSLMQEPARADLKLMSFNLRYGSADDGTNSWSFRRDQVYALVQREDPDLIGTQEGERWQLNELLAGVSGYGEIGEGRNGGTSGEFSSILYKTNTFDAVDSGTFWLSDTPEAPGSTSWGNAIPRICTWARFKHRSSGRGFYLFNTHLDHANQYSREQSAKLIVSRIAGRSATNLPFCFTGDYNAAEDNVVIEYLRSLNTIDGTTAGQDGAEMYDVFRARHPFATGVGTIHGFTGSTSGDRIDYIFHSPKTPHYDARILHDNEGQYPSDHFPITSRFILQPPE